jgi:hypothetical protein
MNDRVLLRPWAGGLDLTDLFRAQKDRPFPPLGAGTGGDERERGLVFELLLQRSLKHAGLNDSQGPFATD